MFLTNVYATVAFRPTKMEFLVIMRVSLDENHFCYMIAQLKQVPSLQATVFFPIFLYENE